MFAARLQDVSHRFEPGWILLHVDWTLPVGGRALLTGDNGSGKTTLLRLLATSLTPTHGRLSLFGESTDDGGHAARGRLALMTHAHFFYEAFSALDNLRLVARLRAPKRLPELHERLAEVGLLRHANAPVATFSAGMKRRLALARVLLLEPELVLWDEPFGQLDGHGVALVEQVLDRLAERRVSWVLSTHDVERGRRLATCHLHLSAGTASEQPLKGAG